MLPLRAIGLAATASLLTLAPAVAARSPRPAVMSFAAGSSSVPAGGAFTTLFGQATHASTCRISVVPALPGFPLALRCAGAFQTRVDVPAGADATFRFTVVARGPGGKSRPRTTVVSRSSTSGGGGGAGGAGGSGTGGQGAGSAGGIQTDAGGTTSNLPACPDGTSFLNAAPADPSQFTYIDPLGHMSGPHVLPDQADHVYFYMQRNGQTAQQTTVYSPGAVTLVSAISQAHFDPADPSAKSYDYELDFSPCRSVLFWFVHVARLSDRLQQALAAIPSPQCQTSTVGNTGTTNCDYPGLDLSLASGEAIGSAGGPGRPFSRSTSAASTCGRRSSAGSTQGSRWVRRAIRSSMPSVRSPTSPTPSTTSSTHVSRSSNAGANGIPACGTTMQDKAGTIQGNWYRQGAFTPGAGGPVDFLDALAIVHSNNDPSQGVISAGGHLVGGDSGTQTAFQPESSGTTDREPGGVTPGATVYCYNGADFTAGHHFDLQLVDANTLKIDYEPGGCTASPTLTNPLTYVR